MGRAREVHTGSLAHPDMTTLDFALPARLASPSALLMRLGVVMAAAASLVLF